MMLSTRTKRMINIDIEKFIKDRIWLGYYWPGTIFPDCADSYWCKLAKEEYKWSIAVDVRGFQNWG